MRVTGGRLGGRSLRAPRGNATRPTTDRVRESLFQVLGDLEGLRVADLYAGTGALGIEALSRGAAWVTFVERRRPALEALRQNIAALGLRDRSAVVALAVERAGEALRAHAPYDLVLADPPWDAVQEALTTLGTLLPSLHLAPDARVVLEHPARVPPTLPEGFPLVPLDARRWGDTAVSMFSAPKQGKS